MIKNNKSAFVSGRDKALLTVPCGQCEECRLQKINDYYVRLYYEWQRYMSNNGSVFFITNSYNDDSLPYTPSTGSVDEVIANSLLSSQGVTIPAGELPCFNKKHIRDFLERLHHIDRMPRKMKRGFTFYKFDKQLNEMVVQDSCFCDNDGVLRNPVLGSEIKHFVVCEFGTQKKRPHYHLLIFFPFIVSASDFKRMCEFCWSDIVATENVPQYVKNAFTSVVEDSEKDDYLEFYDWFCYRSGNSRKKTYYMHKKGFVMFSKHGAQILRPLGMKYLCKYLFKDEQYLKVPYIPEYIETVEMLPAYNSYKEDSQIKRTLHRYKDSVPFFLVSNGLGTLFEQECKLETLEDAKEFATRQLELNNDTKFYKIPQYFVRRLLYQNRHYVNIQDDCKYVTLTYLTEFGKNVMRYKYEQAVNLYVKKLLFVTSNSFRSLLYPSDYKPGDTVPFDVAQFYEMFYNNFMRVDLLRLIAIYKFVYQNVRCDNFDTYTSEVHYDFWLRHSNGLFENQLESKNEYNHVIVGKYIIPKYNEVDVNPIQFYNHLPVFSRFDEVISKVDFLDNLVRSRKYKDSQKKFEEERKYRQFYAKFIYDKVF